MEMECHECSADSIFLPYNFPFLSDKDICPVARFEQYIAKFHPDMNALWQKPKKHPKHSLWYDKQRLGHNAIGNFMKMLLKDANLGKTYTNHSIRVTCITALDKAGFQGRHITAVSGHRSETTVRNYSRRCPEEKKIEMSAALAATLAVPRVNTESVTPAAAPDLKTPQELAMEVISDEDMIKILEESERQVALSENAAVPNPVDPQMAVQDVQNVQNVRNVKYPQSFVPPMNFTNCSNISFNFYQK